MGVAAILRIVLRAPIRIILIVIYQVLPMDVPRILRAISVDALDASSIARGAVLDRHRHVRLVMIMTTILRSRTVLTDLLTRISRTPTLVRVRNAEGLSNYVLTVLRHGLNG